MEDEAFQRELAGSKALMNVSIDRRPGEMPYHFAIDFKMSMTAAQTIVRLYPGAGEAGTP